MGLSKLPAARTLPPITARRFDEEPPRPPGKGLQGQALTKAQIMMLGQKNLTALSDQGGISRFARPPRGLGLAKKGFGERILDRF